MPQVNSDTGTVYLNECSVKTLNAVHDLLKDKPFGTAIDFGRDFAVLLPYPGCEKLSLIHVVSKTYIDCPRLPNLTAVQALVHDSLSDAACLLLADHIKSPSFIDVKGWKRWIVDYFLELKDDHGKNRVEFLVPLIIAIDQGRFENLNDFRTTSWSVKAVL